MKKTSLFFAATALIAALAACSKTPENPTPEEQPGPQTTSEDPKPDAPKSSACDILTFQVVAGNTVVEGDVSAREKLVMLPYYPEEFEPMKSAKAEYTLSEKATISPDPAQEVLDYTVDQKFTVTAEDGTTKEYTVSSREYEVTLQVKRIWEDGKTYGQLKVTPYIFDQNEPMVAFVGPELWVSPDMQVFDLDGNKKGDVNVSGIPAEWYPMGITNDKNGVLVASYAYAADNQAAIDPYLIGGIFIWKDGYDKAPVKLWEIGETDETPQFPNRCCDFHEIAVGGEIAGDFIITTCHYPGWNEYPDEGWFNCWIGKGGDIAGATYQVGKTIRTCSDANCWQLLAPVSGDPNGLFVVVDSHPGTMSYSVQEGLDPLTDLQLYGTLNDDNNISKEAGAQGLFSYGNYTTGHGFVIPFNNTDYLIAITGSWQGEYMTIQTLDPTEEGHYLLETTAVGNFTEPRLSAAAIYDPDNDKVNIMLNVGKSGFFLRYEITREAI